MSFGGGAILTAEAADITGRVVDEKTEKPKEPSTYSTSNPELTENPNTITPGCNGSDKLCKSDTKFYVYQKNSDGTRERSHMTETALLRNLTYIKNYKNSVI